MLQHRQPLPSSVTFSVEARTSASSMPTLPNSLITTAVPSPMGLARNRRTNVVLPAPRKPVTTITGSLAPRACLSLRPNRPASREGKRSSIDFRLTPLSRCAPLPASAGPGRGSRPSSRPANATPHSKIHLQDVKTADVAIDRIDDLALVDEDVVELDGAGRRHRWRWWHEHPDLLRLIWIGNVIGAQSAIEEGAEHDLIGLPAGRPRHVLVDVVGAEAPLGGKCLVIGQRAGRDRDQVGFLARVQNPDELRPILGVVLGR